MSEDTLTTVPSTTTITLEADGAPVRKALDALTAAQAKHSRARLQVLQVEAAERAAADEVFRLDRDLRGIIEMVAKIRGLDLAKEAWSFDTETLSFQKQEQPPAIPRLPSRTPRASK